MNTTYEVQQYVQRRPTAIYYFCANEVWSACSSRPGVVRLANTGKIVRLTRGVYVRPEKIDL